MSEFSCFAIGEEAIASQCLDILFEAGWSILGVCSSAKDNSLKSWSSNHRICFTSSYDEFQAWLSNHQYDYLFDIKSQWIPPYAGIASPQKAVVRYYNASFSKSTNDNEISLAQLNGESQSTVSWRRVTSSDNNGLILKEKAIQILSDDTAFSLNLRCQNLAVQAFEELVSTISSDYRDFSVQDMFKGSDDIDRPYISWFLSFQVTSQSICNLVRASDFGSSRNTLGLPKLWLPGGVIVVKSAVSSTYDKFAHHLPGQILKVDESGLHIAAIDSVVTLNNLFTLDGQQIDLAELESSYGVRQNIVLQPLDSDFLNRVSKHHAVIASYEQQWVNQLLCLSPFTHPYLSFESPDTTAISNIIQRYPIFLPNFESNPKILLSIFAAYCARLTPDFEFDLGLQTKAQRSVAPEVFSQRVPLRIVADLDTSFEAFSTQLEKSLETVSSRSNYCLDITSRYPELHNVYLTKNLPVAIVLADSPDQVDFKSLQASMAFVAYQDGSIPEMLHSGALSDWASNAIIKQLQIFIPACIEHIEMPLSQLPLLSQAELKQILVEWNDTAREYARDKCVHKLFEEQVEKSPEEIALRFQKEEITYRQLNERANQLANHLQALGVGRETLVGICLERSCEMLIGILGILKAGGAYVPIDPNYPEERLRFIVEDTNIPVLLTQRKWQEQVEHLSVKHLCLDSEWETIAKQSPEAPNPGINSQNLMYVIYTSGSTGQPKGVMVPHQGITNLLSWKQRNFSIGINDKVLQTYPFSFDASVCQIFWPLCNGATVVLAEPEGHKDTRYLVKTIQQEGITIVGLVPSIIRYLLQEEGIEKCRSLRQIICGGEALELEIVEDCYAALEVERPILQNQYGPTEASVLSNYWDCESKSGFAIAPIGRPIDNVELYILDKQGEAVPIGVTGELHIGGAGLARGYWNREQLTTEKFIVHPFSQEDGARLYKTGDLARYLPDGNIEFIGRMDYQVKIRGFRIELGEIEAALGQHPSVQQCIVLVREDELSGKFLVAYWVVEAGKQPTAVEDLRKYLLKILPGYMVPSAFMCLESLPLTSSGKVDRRALPKPSASDKQMSSRYVAPQSELEQQLVEIWAKVLKSDQIGIHDNFFELGGHSLLATQVISQIRKVFAVELSLTTFFETLTIAKLSEHIENIRWATSAAHNVDIESSEDYEEGML